MRTGKVRRFYDIRGYRFSVPGKGGENIFWQVNSPADESLPDAEPGSSYFRGCPS